MPRGREREAFDHRDWLFEPTALGSLASGKETFMRDEEFRRKLLDLLQSITEAHEANQRKNADLLEKGLQAIAKESGDGFAALANAVDRLAQAANNIAGEIKQHRK
jgi:hypothetical protein